VDVASEHNAPTGTRGVGVERKALVVMDAGHHAGLARTAHSRTLGAPLHVTPKMNTPISAILERKGSTVYSVAPTATIAEAVAEMNRQKIGSVLILDGGRLAGIFTERDVLRRVVGAGIDPKSVRVSEVMSASLLTITRDATIEDTMKIFTEKRCRHLPVVENGKLLGTVSIGDVTRWMADQDRAEAEQLKNYITGGFPT
jgi:CBS domain-containing protein